MKVRDLIDQLMDFDPDTEIEAKVRVGLDAMRMPLLVTPGDILTLGGGFEWDDDAGPVLVYVTKEKVPVVTKLQPMTIPGYNEP